MCNSGLKIVIFCPFKSLPLGGEKILTFQTWLKKSLVMPSWGQGAKLSWKMPFRGVKMAKCAILAVFPILSYIKWLKITKWIGAEGDEIYYLYYEFFVKVT